MACAAAKNLRAMYDHVVHHKPVLRSLKCFGHVTADHTFEFRVQENGVSRAEGDKLKAWGCCQT